MTQKLEIDSSEQCDWQLLSESRPKPCTVDYELKP